jgi:hypothetical protein
MLSHDATMALRAVRRAPLATAGLVLALGLALGAIAAAAPAGAQPSASAARPAHAGAPDAAADAASVDAIIAALYDVLSGPVGQARDWDRFRRLFVPGARLIPTGRNAQGEPVHAVLSVDDYITSSGPFVQEVGFREREIGRRTETFAGIVHAFSTYEAFRHDETEPFMRGINSIQLWNDGARWWIVTVFWAPERPDAPIPDRYLEVAR